MSQATAIGSLEVVVKPFTGVVAATDVLPARLASVEYSQVIAEPEVPFESTVPFIVAVEVATVGLAAVKAVAGWVTTSIG